MPDNKTVDFQLQWLLLHRCNLECDYCANFLLNEKNEVPVIEIDRLMQFLEKLGRTCRIIFTGGEPFLVSNFMEACREIALKHFVFVISNFTTNRMVPFADSIDPARVGMLGSLHIKELERLGLTGRFIENYRYCRDRGIYITLEEVAYPALIHDADKYLDYFGERDVPFRFVPYSGYYEERKFPEDYTRKEINIFKLKKQDLSRYNRRPGLCNAGYNSFVVMPDGRIYDCFRNMNYFGDIYGDLDILDKVPKCGHRVCECCTSKIDKSLFRSALQECANKKKGAVSLGVD